MSNYVLSFRGQPGREARPEEEAAWGGWFESLGGAVVDFGHRVGRVSMLRNGGAASDDGTTVLTGYVVITADDFEAAIGLAKGCPGLQSGGGVEVAEAVEMA